MGFLGSLFAAKNKFQAQQAPGATGLAGSGEFTQQDFASALEQARNPQLQTNLIDTTQSDQSRGQQQQLSQALMGQAMGTAPSVAQAQLQQAVGNQNAQAATAIGSQRGINPALAARLIAQQQAQNTQGMAGQAATAGIQERQAAQGTLAQALQGQRAQDIGLAQSQVQAGLGLQQASTQEQGVLQNALAQQNQQLLAQNMGVQQLNSQNFNQAQGINAGVAAQNTDSSNKFGAGVLGGVGAALGLAGMGGGKAQGGKIEGHAQVEGDDEQNDTVPAMLSPGEIVLPRSVASDADKAKEFVEHILKGSKKSAKSKSSDEPDYAKVVKSHKKLEERLAALEHFFKGGMAYSDGGPVASEPAEAIRKALQGYPKPTPTPTPKEKR